MLSYKVKIYTQEGIIGLDLIYNADDVQEVLDRVRKDFPQYKNCLISAEEISTGN